MASLGMSSVRFVMVLVAAAAALTSCAVEDKTAYTIAQIDSPVTIMGAGDIADSGSALTNATATGNLIRNANPAYAFTVGDNAYPSGTDSDYATKYDPTWGSFKAKTLPAPGNHDYVSSAVGYMNYFGLANVSYDANSTHLWYAKDLGNGWRFYSLNTEVPTSVGSAQEVWLRNDLAAHPGLHYVAVTHHPRYVSGTSHTDSTAPCPLWNALQAAGGDLFLVGHEHHYERFAKMDCNGALASAGLREFVIGTGGDSQYALGPPHFGQQAVLNTDFGVLKLVLHIDSYDWEFVASGRCWNGAAYDCASRTGMVLDFGTAATNNSANEPPVVSAGLDQTISLPSSANLDGTISDDGLPNPPATVTSSWTKVSGPGTVTFGNAAAVDTTATFSVAGVYVLRLTASDSATSTTDDVQVTVNTNTGETVIDRAVAAGTDDAEEHTASGFMNLTSTDLELVNDGTTNQRVGMRFVSLPIPRNATITRAYVQFAVDETVGSTGLSFTIKGFAQDNTTTFTTAANNISSRPVTTATVTGWAPPLWTTVGAAGVDQQTPELKTIVQEIVNRPGWVSGNALGIVVTGPDGVRTAGAFDNGTGSQPVLHVQFTTPNTAPTVSAGADQTITLPASASLDGTIGDDGLPSPPGAVTSTWTQVSGPGTATFGNASAADTTATFSAVGVYVLRLTASDSALSTSDDVQITVTNTPTIIERAVAAGTDDAEELTDGFMNLTSTDLELVNDGTNNQRVGMRFVNLSIPRNATITRAYVQFTVDEAVGSTGLSLTIKGFAQDNTATFTTATSNISARAVTAAGVTGWNPPLWTTIGTAGVDQRTPELKTIVQEIVNRAGWVSGNALGIVVTGPGGVRTAGSFDNGNGTQPVLHVEYTVP
jgi:hypothetical protein